MEMPEGLKEELDRITAQDPDKLNDYDAGFLRARATYLDYSDVVKFAKVLRVSDFKPMQEEPKVAKDLPFDGVVMTESPKPVVKKVVKKKVIKK